MLSTWKSSAFILLSISELKTFSILFWNLFFNKLTCKNGLDFNFASLDIPLTEEVSLIFDSSLLSGDFELLSLSFIFGGILQNKKYNNFFSKKNSLTVEKISFFNNLLISDKPIPSLPYNNKVWNKILLHPSKIINLWFLDKISLLNFDSLFNFLFESV